MKNVTKYIEYYKKYDINIKGNKQKLNYSDIDKKKEKYID